MRVCVLDDDPMVLEVVCKTIVDLGHVALPAQHVASALETISLGIDVAVVDILMPDRDGLDFIMSARRLQPGLRIVAISGGGQIGAATVLAMAKGLGADAALLKPFSESELEQALGD